MKGEIEAAVHFVGRVIVSSTKDSISSFSEFKDELSKVMERRFKGHWHDDSPLKGQGYRSIRIHPTEPLDPVLSQAAVKSKFSCTHLRIPVELTVWVDPKDVSCRFGDLKATYCTVLKDQDNQAGTLDVEELLENAKALYSRQQHFVITDGPQPPDIPFVSSTNDLFGYGMQMNGFNDSYLYPPYGFTGMYPPWQPDGMTMDGSTPPPLPYSPSMPVNATPRKNGKSSHFRKGSNGTGRTSKHHQHHHHHHHHHHNGGDGGFSNQNHLNNNHNSNMNTPNANLSNGRSPAGGRFQLVKGTKNFHQFYSQTLPPQNLSYGHMHQQKHHHVDLQQTPSKKRMNSESDKDSK
ncbi:hypothetical protein ACOMHN_035411 [Nucella lapillus]